MKRLFYWLFPLYGWYMFKWSWGLNENQINYLKQKSRQIKENHYKNKYCGCTIEVNFW